MLTLVALGRVAAADSDSVALESVGNASVQINWSVLDTLGPGAQSVRSPVLFVPIVSAAVETAGDARPAPIAGSPLATPAPPLVAPDPAPALAVMAAAAVPEAEAAPVPAPEPAAQPATTAALAPAEPVPAEPLEGASPLPEPGIVEPAAVEPLEEPEPQVASLGEPGPADLATPGLALSVAFPPGGSELLPETIAALDGVIVAMLADEGARIQLMAYAGLEDGSASQARRLSLSRALAVRGYLIERGVRSTRIDVRALGDNVAEGSPERVDVVALPR